MDNKSDPRTRDYPLMDSPFPTIAISLTYAYFVKVSGVAMENHPICLYVHLNRGSMYLVGCFQAIIIQSLSL